MIISSLFDTAQGIVLRVKFYRCFNKVSLYYWATYLNGYTFSLLVYISSYNTGDIEF